MRHLIIYFLYIALFNSGVLLAQEKFTISGTIMQEDSNETLIGVNILIPELNIGTTTNEYGFYSITLPPATYEIVISYVGFKDHIETIVLIDNVTKKISL